MILHCEGAEATEDFGAFLADYLNPGDVITLEAPLGGGKTTLARGICRGLGISAEEVSSPTYVLLHIYAGRLPVYHFDLYRIHSPAELHPIGAEDYLWGDGLALVEWPALAATLVPPDRLDVQIEYLPGGQSEDSRRLTLMGHGRWKQRLDLFGRAWEKKMPDTKGLLLALDTTGDTFSLALSMAGKELAEYCGGTPRQHLTELFGVLEDMLESAGLGPADIAAIAVTNGPGSFTGVRLGVLIARTLGQVLNCPIVPVNALEALALACAEDPAAAAGLPLVVALDARKNEILSAVFQFVGGKLGWREPAQLFSSAQWIESIPARATVLGNALGRYGADLANARPELTTLPAAAWLVRGSAVARLGSAAWRQKMFIDWQRLAPEYVRPADVQVHA